MDYSYDYDILVVDGVVFLFKYHPRTMELVDQWVIGNAPHDHKYKLYFVKLKEDTC